MTRLTPFPIRSIAILIPVLCLLLADAGGCARRDRGPTIGPVPANGFVKHWSAELNLERRGARADRLFLRDGLVFLYTEDNRGFILSAAGGQLQASSQLTDPRGQVRPPVLLGDKIVYPALATIEVYERSGRHLASQPLDRATRSPAAPLGNFLYFGVDYYNGGRLVKYDVTRPYGAILWELMTFAPISASPAAYEDVIYAASEDGRVYAVAPDRDPVWPIEGNTFRTGGRIMADLVVDDSGLYVASMDSKLYALDRGSGRIKWSYFAGVPLREPPVLTGDRVYQHVPGRGLIAIDKNEGQIARDPLWVAPGAVRFLSTDNQHVYVLTRRGSVAALDRNTGEPRFHTRRRDFAISAPNTRDATIYVATRDGELLAIRPVLNPGTVGEMVRAEPAIFDRVARRD